MKTIITVKTGKGKRTSKGEYKEAVDELFYITEKIDWMLKECSQINFVPLKDGAKLIAK